MITQDTSISDIPLPLTSITQDISPSGQNIYDTHSALSDIDMDRFGRSGFSRKIAAAVSQRKNQGSIVMGLNGQTGCGRTTILNFVESELRHNDGAIVVRYSAALYNNEEEITRAFFGALADLDFSNSDFPEKSSCAELLSVYTEILLQGNSSLIHTGSEIPDKVIPGQHFSIKDTEILKDRIARYFASAGKHIAILVDDVDKLDKTSLRALLRLIKLNANFPNTIYILAFESNHVAGVLGNNSGNDKIAAGRKFLEKIFQVAIDIPPVEKRKLEKFCFDSVTDLLNIHRIIMSNENHKHLFRAIKNGFSMRLDIGKCSQYRKALSETLTGVVNSRTIDGIFLLEGIKVFYPDVYELIKNNSAAFQKEFHPGALTSETSAIKIVEDFIADFSDEEKKAVVYLVSTLFPAAMGYEGTEHSSLISNIQPASGTGPDESFDKYFVLQEEPGEAAAGNLDDLLSMLENADTNAIGEMISEVTGSIGNDSLIEMLIERNDSISEAGSINLIGALGNKGTNFTNPESLFSFSTVFSHPGIVIRDLLENISEKTKRFQTASDLLIKSEPVNFAFEAYRWMCTIDEDKEARLFSVSEEEQLGRMLAERIAYLTYGEPVYIKNPEEAPFLLDTWAYLAGREVTSNYLLRTFEENKNNIIAFIKCYLPADSDPNETGSIRLNQFNSIGKIIEHKDVFTSLLDSAGEDFLYDAAQTKDRSTTAAGKFARAYKDFVPVRNSQPSFQNNRKNEQTSSDSRRKFVQVKKGIYRPFTPDLEI